MLEVLINIFGNNETARAFRQEMREHSETDEGTEGDNRRT